MTSKLEQQMAANAANRRRPQDIDDAVAETVIGRMGRETEPPQMLRLDNIRMSRFQSRGRVDQTYLENLAESIREEGLHDPIIVRPLPRLVQVMPGEECHTMTPPPQQHELVAGHNRILAFELLGRFEIPGFVRPMSDIEAARALTTENTHRKNLDDWELYKHAEMLRKAGACKNNTDLARLLNIARTVVPALDAFREFPQAAHQLLDDHPGLVGYNLAQKLKPYCPEHALTVFDALVLLSKGKLTQASVPGWIEDKVNPPKQKYRKDVQLSGGVRIVLAEDGARVSGNLDYERLHKLIEDNLDTLLMAEK